ncbi:MAG: tRNA pseudouridine(55) synthase TruB, partial [Candidatus Paceibacterota bacterium]
MVPTPRDSTLVLVYKPRGMSSFDVIRQLRKKLNIRKMGHAGTLDPLAEGLLLIGIQEGTKKLADYVGLDKVYRVEIELGERTASGDKEGDVLEERNVALDEVEEKDVLGVLESLSGEIELPVPIYSAVKKAGAPLYARARRGEIITPPKRVMSIYSLTLLACTSNAEHTRVFLSVDMHVGSGVYVRSIAEEIGR